MKKLLIILLTISSMGFTVDDDRNPAGKKGQAPASASGGYLEVISSGSYSITLSRN